MNKINMVEEVPDDPKLFDTSQTDVKYTRSRNTQTVVLTFLDPTGISELKLYLLLCLEIEKLEQRLGIFNPIDEKH